MLGADAYRTSYSDIKYREAKDHTDLLTALAGDLQDVEDDYNKFNFQTRKRTFDKNDQKENAYHQAAGLMEQHLDTAIKSLCIFLPTPHEQSTVERIYKKNKKIGWNDTSANRLELKIRNTKRIILWFKNEYSMVLRKRYWFENNSIYVGGHGHVPLPEDTFTTVVAKILFKNPDKIWPMADFMDAIAKEKDIPVSSIDYDEIDYSLVKRCSQAINDKITDANGFKTKLVVCIKSQVRLNTTLFHILDRITTE